MTRRSILILANTLALLLLCLFSQGVNSASDTIFNQTDSQNLRQGHWKVRYPTGIIAYQGYFVDNKPRGLFRRYHENSLIRARMVFSECGDSTQTTLYYPSGRRVAQGRHYKTRKDGEWRYYSESQNLVLTEQYRHGMKQGVFITYYPTGEVFERISWQNDLKHGPTVQFYESGLIKSSAQYREGVQHGSVKVYYYGGTLRLEGEYSEGLKHGEWRIYSPNGDVQSATIYHNGIAENEDEIIRNESLEFERMLKNVGRIQEPSVMDFIEGGAF